MGEGGEERASGGWRRLTGEDRGMEQLLTSRSLGSGSGSGSDAPY